MNEQQMDMHILVEQLGQKDKQIAAQKIRIEFLEQRLAQRTDETKQDYAKLLQYMEPMRARVLAIFQDLPSSVGLTAVQLQNEFDSRYPNIHSVNVVRRAYELVGAGKLWKATMDKRTTFYLMLKDKEQP